MPPPWTGKGTWIRTLATKDPAVAKRVAVRFLAACSEDFETAERMARGEPTAARPVRLATAIPRPEEIEADECV